MRVTGAYVEELGPTSLIRHGALDVADPGPRDVLIETHALTVNPVDTFVRSGRFPTRVQLPLLLGRDVVGRVGRAPVGSGFREGQWVWANSLGYDGRQGAYADAVVAPLDRVYPLPEGVDPRVAVAAAHPASTAALGFAKSELAPGDVVFIGGAGGNVGGAAVALAARSGARVIATASPRDAERVHGAGAHEVVDHHDPGALSALVEQYRGGARLVWDTSGRMDFSVLAGLVALGGQILVTAAGPDAVPVPWAALYTRDVTVRGFVHSRAGAKELARAAQSVNRMLAGGAWEPLITDEVPLAEAARVHERMERGEIRGRVILRP